MGLAGVLDASRSVFAVNQDMSYGVALLMTGTSETAGDIALNIFKRIQPTLDLILAQQVSDLYSGKWLSGDGNSTTTIEVSGGSLWINSLVLEGTDVLRMTQGLIQDDGKEPMPITMWSTGRTHEFRYLRSATFHPSPTHLTSFHICFVGTAELYSELQASSVRLSTRLV